MASAEKLLKPDEWLQNKCVFFYGRMVIHFPVRAETPRCSHILTILINRDLPSLNRNRHLLLLEVFDDWGT